MSRRWFIGKGVLEGMWVTFREFLGTYPVGRAVLKLLRQPTGDGLFTIQYPEKRQEHHERFRYFPFLIYDGTPDNLRCVACKICEQECPPACIHIVVAKDEQGRPLKAHGRPLPKEFDIDTSICMSCRICVDVCPFDAIEMDNQYEMSSTERFGEMLFNKEKLLRSNEYFQKIKPEEAKVVDARMAAKAAKAQAPTPQPPQTPPEAQPPAGPSQAPGQAPQQSPTP